MKVCVAQTRPIKGDISGNIANHIKLIELAVSLGADTLVFPELSLTGYEPRLAETLATHQDDERLDVFQKWSDTFLITICVGLPTPANTGIQISMIIFQARLPRLTYSKQYLHPDEYPYFIPGHNPALLTALPHKMAPAICYESFVPPHAENAFKSGADIYLASVAKSMGGVEKAARHFPAIAQKYAMTVLMSNCVGPCDDFNSIGKTSIWNNKGVRVGQMNETDEGIILIDTVTEEITQKTIEN